LFGLGLSGRAEVEAFERFVKASQIDESKVTQGTLDEIVRLYPANTEQLPFSSGDSLFDRAAAWYGDSMFLAPRRRFTAALAAAKCQPIFTYLFTEFVPGDTPRLGGTFNQALRYERVSMQFMFLLEILPVFHASELRLLFGPVPGSGVELEFANAMLDFYIHFVNDLNPGRMCLRLVFLSLRCFELATCAS
jgi:hypothetical protein